MPVGLSFLANYSRFLFVPAMEGQQDCEKLDKWSYQSEKNDLQLKAHFPPTFKDDAFADNLSFRSTKLFTMLYNMTER